MNCIGKLNYTDAKFLGDVKTEATGCQPFVHRSAFVLCSFGASVMSHQRDAFATVCENQRVVMHARQQKQAEKSRKKLSEAANNLQHAKQQNLLLEEQVQQADDKVARAEAELAKNKQMKTWIYAGFFGLSIALSWSIKERNEQLAAGDARMKKLVQDANARAEKVWQEHDERKDRSFQESKARTDKLLQQANEKSSRMEKQLQQASEKQLRTEKQLQQANEKQLRAEKQLQQAKEKHLSTESQLQQANEKNSSTESQLQEASEKILQTEKLLRQASEQNTRTEQRLEKLSDQCSRIRKREGRPASTEAAIEMDGSFDSDTWEVLGR
jgi:hypothetical protein